MTKTQSHLHLHPPCIQNSTHKKDSIQQRSPPPFPLSRSHNSPSTPFSPPKFRSIISNIIRMYVYPSCFPHSNYLV
ncbi:unnamed protein product [Periconia digitata]|uniref:Uncharacterized protein n=1 Tax=Periconia digitata TaxID=1303443 RepID=A0A9W4XLF1_9PLEO|nr:unnamed protein product [Periconia digitata]